MNGKKVFNLFFSKVNWQLLFCIRGCLKIGSLELIAPIVSLVNSQRKATIMSFMLSKVHQQASQIPESETGCCRLTTGYADSTVESDTTSLL